MFWLLKRVYNKISSRQPSAPLCSKSPKEDNAIGAKLENAVFIKNKLMIEKVTSSYESFRV